MTENICKWSDWQGINLQNIQTAHAVQQQINEQTHHRMGRRPNYIFLKGRHTYGQKAHEKMLNITREITREMKIKAIMRYYLILVSITIIKNV